MSGAAQAPEVIIALVNAVAGRETEFNRWYTEEHLPEVVLIEGVVSAQRYELPEPFLGQLPYAYATIYEVEGSAAAVIQRIYTAEYATQSDALDVQGMIMSPFAPLGERITANGTVR